MVPGLKYFHSYLIRGMNGMNEKKDGVDLIPHTFALARTLYH